MFDFLNYGPNAIPNSPTTLRTMRQSNLTSVHCSPLALRGMWEDADGLGGDSMKRKAVSQIVSALLLIAIAIAAAIILYVYSIGLVGQMQTSGGQGMKAELILEGYDWSNLNVLSLTVRNVGSTALNLQMADIMVNGRLVAAYTLSGCVSPSAVPASVSCMLTLTVPSTGLVSGAAYSVKVVTPDGATFAWSCTAGSTG